MPYELHEAGFPVSLCSQILIHLIDGGIDIVQSVEVAWFPWRNTDLNKGGCLVRILVTNQRAWMESMIQRHPDPKVEFEGIPSIDLATNRPFVVLSRFELTE